jgi:sulfatase maturation enzyme AslB (radical SAM superfamily)
MLKYCSSPWDTVFILSTGCISPCLCPDWHTLGVSELSLLDTPLVDIYNSSNFQKLRSSIEDQSFKHCNPRQCSKIHTLDQVDQIPKFKLHLPTNINLGIDKNCNLKCESCRTTNIYSKEIDTNAKIILDKLVDAYKDFKTPVFVYCDATGDIFASAAYREFFLRSDLPKCFKFCIQTNGNLVTKNLDLIDKIRDQIDIFIISFDAATPETYKQVRGGVFDLVVAGVERLIERGITVTTQYVLQQTNCHEVMDYYKLCKKLGVSYIGVQKLDRWEHMSADWWRLNRLERYSQVNDQQLLDDLLILSNDPIVGLCGGLKSLIDKR